MMISEKLPQNAIDGPLVATPTLKLSNKTLHNLQNLIRIIAPRKLLTLNQIGKRHPCITQKTPHNTTQRPAATRIITGKPIIHKTNLKQLGQITYTTRL